MEEDPLEMHLPIKNFGVTSGIFATFHYICAWWNNSGVAAFCRMASSCKYHWIIFVIDCLHRSRQCSGRMDNRGGLLVHATLQVLARVGHHHCKLLCIMVFDQRLQAGDGTRKYQPYHRRIHSLFWLRDCLASDPHIPYILSYLEGKARKTFETAIKSTKATTSSYKRKGRIPFRGRHCHQSKVF